MEFDTSRVEAVSLLGRPLYPLRDTAGAVAAAEIALAAHPRDLDHFLALGTAYHTVWRYTDCLRIYTRALTLVPDTPSLYRHRGHRAINLRRFDTAIMDLERAAKLDHASFDIWYHLGLARYLKGDFLRAGEAYQACLACSHTDDKVVATADWLYMTLRRLGQPDAANRVLDRIHEGMAYGDNVEYFNRLLVYQGKRDPESVLDAGPGSRDPDLSLATRGYGIATWYLDNGDSERAFALFRQIVQGAYWPAFGYVAAEAELARAGERA